MSAVLDVRALYVLFGDAGERQMFAPRVLRALLTDPVTAASIVFPPGYSLGLADVSFSVNAGDCLAVLGKSGSGKSSLLRTLAGLHPAGKGSVAVNANDVSTRPPEQRGVVYLHQEPVLFPHLSVLDNVAFPMTIRGVDRRTSSRRAMEWLTRLHVAETMSNYPQALSGGQRHRVALARALSAEPAVLLLDEPLSSLDPEVRRDVRNALQEVRDASGAAMILVTHDLDDALAVASHIAVIGPFADLSEPLSPEGMLDKPPHADAARLLGVFTELAGEIREDRHFHWLGGRIPADRMPEGRAVVFVRPHDLRVERVTVANESSLVVTGRRDAAHDVALTVRAPGGDAVSVRIASGSDVSVGDAIVVHIDHARFFPAD